MFMTATRIKIHGKPVLKLNIHDFDEDDISFLDSLGINQIEGDSSNWRYIHIHSQENFLKTRSAILERYIVTEEKGTKVILKKK